MSEENTHLVYLGEELAVPGEYAYEPAVLRFADDDSVDLVYFNPDAFRSVKEMDDFGEALAAAWNAIIDGRHK